MSKKHGRRSNFEIFENSQDVTTQERVIDSEKAEAQLEAKQIVA